MWQVNNEREREREKQHKDTKRNKAGLLRRKSRDKKRVCRQGNRSQAALAEKCAVVLELESVS